MLDGTVPDDVLPPTSSTCPPRGPRRRRPILWLAVAALALFFIGDTLLSYYVESVWFASLGYGEVFWKTLGFQGAVFAAFAAATLGILFGGFLALEPPQFRPGGSGTFIVVNGRPVQLPVGRVLRFLAFAGSAVIALIDRAAEWRPAGRRSRCGGTDARRRRCSRAPITPSIRSSDVRSPSTCSRFLPGKRSRAG